MAMTKTYSEITSTTSPQSAMQRGDLLALRAEPTPAGDELVHSMGGTLVCDTDARGHSTPQGKSPLEIVLDATEGFVPLWAQGVTLRWRFNEGSLSDFANPDALKTEVRALIGEALLAWGTAAPVRFTEDRDVWDFEVIVRSADQCSPRGCVLARAFFPDAGRHDLTIFPKMFAQPRGEQIDTLTHEIGHIFGLRHFFAQVSEEAWPAEIFGTHSKFSIMNYGELSTLTPADRSDLQRLYRLVWSGALIDINGTPIRQVQPYHTLAPTNAALTALRPAATYVPVSPAALMPGGSTLG